MATVDREGERIEAVAKEARLYAVEESRHTRIVLGSRVSRMPRHPAKGNQDWNVTEYPEGSRFEDVRMRWKSI